MIRVLLLLALLSSPLAAQIRFHPVERETVLERLASAPVKNEDRQQALENLFTSVGCHPTEQPLKHSKLANVICVLPGTTDDVIIVGGHMDKVWRGKGIIDDWSGSSLLPTLYESLKSLPHRHTFVFVGFTEEELGLVGSAYYVKQMTPEARAHAKAMVNLECLGLTTMKVWASRADPKLLAALGEVAQAMQMDVAAVNVEKVGSADSESFVSAKIPRITLHSITQPTFRLLHTDDDNMKAIKPDVYYDNYRLIAAYLATLDEVMDKPAETQGATQ